MGSSVGNLVIRTFVVLTSVLLVACDRIEPPEKSGRLVIGILAGPTSYQDEAGTASGFEHDLLENFAATLGLKTRYVFARDQSSLIALVKSGGVHLAAGVAIENNPKLLFSAPIREAKQVLVGNADDPYVDDNPVDLSGRTVEVLLDSPLVATLQTLAGNPTHFTITEIGGISVHGLLQRLAEGKSHLAATDMLNYLLALDYFPELTVVRELPGQTRSGWAFTGDRQQLWREANLFIAAARKDGSLARLLDRYFGHIQRIKGDGIARFIDDIDKVLPRYRQLFQSAQAATGIDWRLIAALAYQESKWDPLATSFTNVRGIMMLTEDTADQMKVTDRLDPAQSIHAGARYFATLMEELPDEIKEPDRTWLALAAYNLGMGHLNGARTFARQMKRDSTSWYDMKKVLPLMSQPEYYSHLKSGPARGGEAVILVENVRNYYDILSRLEPAWQPTPRLSLSSR